MENNFTHFEKVVVRSGKDSKWRPDFFGYNTDDSYCCVGGFWSECLPYNEKTACLINTTNEYIKPYEPNDGDFVTVVEGKETSIFVYSKEESTKTCYGKYAGLYKGRKDISLLKDGGWCSKNRKIRPSTDDEIQFFVHKLKSVGKQWDPNKKEIVVYKWKPTLGEGYWFVTGMAVVRKSSWYEDSVDTSRYNVGNCFQTEYEAQTIADKFKEILKNCKQ